MNKIKETLLDTELVKRLKALEEVLDHNDTLHDLIVKLKAKQKQMVHAKEFNQPKQYQVYFEEYQQIYQEVIGYPFVEEYIDLLEEVNNILLTMANHIETKINLALKD